MSDTSIRQWLSDSISRIQNKQTHGLLQSLYYAYAGALLSMETRVPIGTNVFDREWDLLIILDACRIDALHAVADEYDFLTTIDSMWSVGSTSNEWMALTFRESYADEIRRTAYVNGNCSFRYIFRDEQNPLSVAAPFYPSLREYTTVAPSDFAHIDDVYQYGFDTDTETVMPQTMTERAVDVGRTHNPDRCIVHYMQPHSPYIGVEGAPGGILRDLNHGSLSKQEAWEAYIENLRAVLDSVETLLNNYDADRVAITADHGEGFGEWGFYSHNVACPHPTVRQVPWAETTATDNGSLEPSIDPERGSSVSIEKQLEYLGYK